VCVCGGGGKGERKGWRGRGDGGREKEMEGRMVGRGGNGLLNCGLVARESGNVPGGAPTTSG